MRLVRVDVRFFRSFNYDFELKARTDSSPLQWEDTDPAWHPFVRVPLERDITAIVGANEAGKSQLLSAIKAALTGAPIERADFCRYSDLYSVMMGGIRLPEFGGTYQVEADEIDDISLLSGVAEFSLYRPGDKPPFLVVDNRRVEIDATDLSTLEARLPTFHELRTDLAIPDSVSIRQLAGRPRTILQDRRRRTELLDVLSELAGSTEAVVGQAVLPVLSSGLDEASRAAELRRQEEFELARKLLVDVARVDSSTFSELEQAIASEREGQVAAIVGGINSAIHENLNVQRWWTQDRDFDLLVEAREQELAFTIQDRTASKYSFAERSQGLRFFLSYFVQLSAHRLNNSQPDVLLLDEPDAFLSSVGQQDLLRVLHEYALPENGGARSQVVYVTHSPFLIDKNAPHRIRVLDKGAEDEGTRVVKDAANNRYEPLRSSLGTHVAETAFIGGQNLFVEGAGDQILIAGLAAHLARRRGATDGGLDLNAVTVVASGGADGIPYLVYLARGRDTIKPACVVLLDGDESGRNAERVLKRGEARKKRVLQDRYILRLDEWAESVDITLEPGVAIEEIEDLIPIAVARRAALNYFARFSDLTADAADTFTDQSIQSRLEGAGGRLWEALTGAYGDAFPDEHLEKAGLAREVISLLGVEPDVDGADLLRERFASLLSRLTEMLDDAYDEEERSRTDDRLKRAIRNFVRNHPNGIKKPEAMKLLREIGNALGDSAMGDALRPQIAAIHREFELSNLVDHAVPRFSEFRERVRSFGNQERIAFQDDALRDPASTVLGVSGLPGEAATPIGLEDAVRPGVSNGDVGDLTKDSPDVETLVGR